MAETLRSEVRGVLERHGVPASPELVDALVNAADKHTEWWSDEAVAAYVGTIMPRTVRFWLRNHGVPTGERRLMTPAEVVRQALARSAGQGMGGGRPKHGSFAGTRGA